jgi:vancomycin aglycone glucosyltransferase
LSIPDDMRGHVDAAGLVTVPYGRDWQDLLRDNDFTTMLQNPVAAISQAVEYVTQSIADKTSTLLPLAEDADLIVAGMTEQGAATNIAELTGIPLAALHFFPSQLLQGGSPQAGMATQAGRAHRRALGLPDEVGGRLARPLEIQAYDRICVPRLADQWAADGQRPFVGALTAEMSTPTDEDTLAWIAAGPAPVYFGFGSTPVAEPADTVAVITEACARLGIRGLICLGPHDLGGGTMAEHVQVVRDVNHASVFPRCRAVVHHGGAGTTAAGLRAGAPALILWNGLDQPMWAAAAQQLGVGFGRRFSEATLDSLTADLSLILTPQYAARAREVAGLTTSPADSLAVAVDLLEQAASSQP